MPFKRQNRLELWWQGYRPRQFCCRPIQAPSITAHGSFAAVSFRLPQLSSTAVSLPSHSAPSMTANNKTLQCACPFLRTMSAVSLTETTVRMMTFWLSNKQTHVATLRRVETVGEGPFFLTLGEYACLLVVIVKRQANKAILHLADPCTYQLLFLCPIYETEHPIASRTHH